MTPLSPELPGAAEEAPTGGLGRHLREARAAARISLDDVAIRLRLDRRVVEALERDDYAGLPQATFVRGYLRSYARLLGVPPAPLVEAYDRLGFEPPRLVADIATRSSRRQARSTDLPVRLVTYALIVALAVLGALWWRFEKAPMDTTARQARAPEEPRPAPSGPAADRAPVDPEQVAATRAPAPSPPAAAVATPPVPPSPASRPARPTPEAIATAPAPLVPPASPTPAAPPAPAAPAATGASAALPGGPGLVLRLQHDSWVEVYEQGGKRLFFNLAKSGQTLTLRGTPPYRVILGYAREAEVEYNGAAFDIAPHTSRDVARFTVGE